MLEASGWERSAHSRSSEPPCKLGGKACVPWELQPDSESNVDPEAGFWNCPELDPRSTEEGLSRFLPGFSLFLLCSPDS